jgi:hypothetical protein
MTVGIVLRRVFIDCSAVQGGFRRVSLRPNAFITLSIVAKLGLPVRGLLSDIDIRAASLGIAATRV